MGSVASLAEMVPPTVSRDAVVADDVDPSSATAGTAPRGRRTSGRSESRCIVSAGMGRQLWEHPDALG